MSRRSLGTLTIDVLAEVGGFVSGMDKSERRTETWRKNVEKQAKLAGIALGTGLAAGAAAIGVGLIRVAKNTMAAEQEIAQLDAIIRSTGGAAGYTRQQLLGMADTLSSKSTFSGGEIVEAQTRLLSYSGILGENIPRAMQAVIDQSARLGISVSQSAETIGRALESPGKAAAALAQSGFGAAFTKEVRGTIDQLVKAGKEGEAQVMILEILEESYGGAAQAARDTFGGALQALGNTIDDITTGGDGSLQGATTAVNSLIDILNDPGVKEGFDNILAGFGNILVDFSTYLKDGNEVRNLTDSIAESFRQISDLGGIFSGAVEGLDRLRGGLVAIERQGNAVVKLASGQYSGLFGSEGGGFSKFLQDYQAGTDFADKGWQAMQPKAPPRVILIEPTVPATGVTGDAGARAEAEAASKAAEEAKKNASALKQLQSAYNSELLKYQRIVETTNTDAGRLARTTKEQEAIFDTTKGALKGLSEARKRDVIEAARAADAVLELARANEESASAAEYAANLERQLSNARAAIDVDFAGAGLGSVERERARALLQIQADYQQKRDELFQQNQSGDISDSLYRSETDALAKALDERLRIQEEYYRRTDEQRADWKTGMADAWADYATDASDANKQAYDAVSGFLDTTTGDVAESIQELVKGNESAFDSVKNLAVSMGETVINTLSQMAAQWLVYQAVQAVVGKTGAASAAAGLTGNAVATAAQAALAAYASTAAIPIIGPALAPAAAATAMAATAPLVATVTASSLVGMAHDGIDAVPQTGTWLLQQGERVTTASTSAKLDATLERVNRDVGRDGSNGPMYFNFEVGGSIGERERRMMREAVTEAVTLSRKERVQDVASGKGPQSRAMQANWNVGRRVG